MWNPTPAADRRRCARAALVLLGPCALLVALSGCVGYTPPPPLTVTQYDRIVNANYDQTWEALIDYTASTYFTIDHFEKASGLMTLTFGQGEPGRFIDCGHWKSQDYNGNYAARPGGKLISRMNIRIRSLDAHHTSVKVNANYVFQFMGETWNFDTGRAATVRLTDNARGTSPARTCEPTHQAEADVLAGIQRSLR